MSRSGSVSSVMSGVTLNDIPNLPGFRRNVSTAQAAFPKKYKAFKGQTISEDFLSADDDSSLQSYFQGSIRDSSLISLPAMAKSFNDISGRYSLRSQQQDRAMSRHNLPFSSKESMPSFILSDHPQGRICKFSAFFYETNPNEPNNPLRTRFVDILFYVVDGTIEILEPRVVNSGTMQGQHLKRHKIPRDGVAFRQPSTRSSTRQSSRLSTRQGSRQRPSSRGGRLPPLSETLQPESALSENTFLTLDDFFAGAEVTVYQRKYIIADCDAATKIYFENELDRSFGEPISEIPQRDYNFCYTDSKPGPVAYGAAYTEEYRASTASSRAASKPNTASRSFYEYDKMILRFYGVWDNRDILYGDRILCQVHYYLADNTFEVIPIRERNSGRDPVSTLLRRTKIFKPDEEYDPAASRASLGSFGSVADFGSPTAAEPYSWKDLHIGLHLRIAALDILLTDADSFTRDFYSTKRQPLGESITGPSELDEMMSQSWEPASDGMKSASSIMSDKSKGYLSININGQYKPRDGDPFALPPKGSLISEAPFKDGAKLKELQGIVLRYTAVIKNPSTTDMNRTFILLYHCEDDTVEIKEVMQRNSGHVGGHFATRSKIVNKYTSRYLSPQDLFLNAIVHLNGLDFQITDSDDLTLHYMENNCKTIWTDCDLRLVLSKVMAKKAVLVKLILVTKNLANTVLTYDEVEKLVKLAGFGLHDSAQVNKQEIYTLCRAVDTTYTKKVKLTKLLKFVVDYNTEDWEET